MGQPGTAEVALGGPVSKGHGHCKARPPRPAAGWSQLRAVTPPQSPAELLRAPGAESSGSADLGAGEPPLPGRHQRETRRA